MGVLLESYEVTGDWGRWEGVMINGGARVREVEEAEEEPGVELGVSLGDVVEAADEGDDGKAGVLG